MFLMKSSSSSAYKALLRRAQTAHDVPRKSLVSSFSTATIDNHHDDHEEEEKPRVAPFGTSQHKNHYQWDDPLLFRETQLTEEERNVWDMANAFCQQELQPQILEANRNETHNGRQLMKSMGEVGLLGATLPAKYGGSDLGYVSYGLLATEVERVDSGYRSCMSVQSSLVMYPIYAYGTEEMKLKYLPELASGNLVGCFGLTEPNHGSDPAGMETTSTYDAATNEYVLNGSKNWITNSPSKYSVL